MRAIPVRVLWAVLLVATTAGGPLSRAADKETEAEQIAALIKQLGDRSFAKRQAASKALEELGEKALPGLQKAAASTEDLETRPGKTVARTSSGCTRARRQVSNSWSSTRANSTWVRPAMNETGGSMR